MLQSAGPWWVPLTTHLAPLPSGRALPCLLSPVPSVPSRSVPSARPSPASVASPAALAPASALAVALRAVSVPSAVACCCARCSCLLCLPAAPFASPCRAVGAPSLAFCRLGPWVPSAWPLGPLVLLASAACLGFPSQHGSHFWQVAAMFPELSEPVLRPSGCMCSRLPFWPKFEVACTTPDPRFLQYF